MNDPDVKQQSDDQTMQSSGPDFARERPAETQGVAYLKKGRFDSVWHGCTTFSLI
jgi:hypothetical protein